MKDDAGAISLLKPFLKSSASSSTGIDEYVDSSLRSLLAHAQIASGQGADTLLKADRSNLSALASTALRDERWNFVKQLIAACQSTNSNDLEFLRLRSRLAEHEQRWEDVMEDCAKAQEIIRTESDRSQLSREINRIQRTAHLKSGRSIEFYDRQEEQNDTFRNFATSLIRRREWSEFKKLAEHHRSNAPEDPFIPQLSSEFDWYREDYVACARSCEEAVKKATADPENKLGEWQVSRLQALQLDCLLHLKRHLAAKTLAQLALENEQDSIPLAIVAAAAAAAGNVEEARRLADDAFEKSKSVQRLYAHHEVGPFFLHESFADLHERCPVEIPNLRAGDKAVFLFDAAPSLDSNTITQLIQKLAPNQQPVVEECESVHSKVTAAFAVKLSNSTIQLVSGIGPFDDWQLSRPDPQHSPIIKNSTAWLAISDVSWTAHGEQDFRINRQLARQLSPEATGICVFSNWSWRLLQPDGPEVQQWETTGTLSSFPALGVGIESKDSDTVEPTRKFTQTLSKVAMSMSADEARGLEVQCLIGNPQLGEPLWIEVQDARHTSYGSFEFDGVLKSSSKLLPQMREGLKVNVSQWEVLAWRRPDEPIHIHPDYRH